MLNMKKLVQSAICALSVACFAHAANAMVIEYKYDEKGFSGALEITDAQKAEFPNSSAFEIMTSSDDGHTCSFSGVGVVIEDYPFIVYDPNDEQSRILMLYSNDTYYVLKLGENTAPCGLRGYMLGRYIRDYGN